MWRYAKRMAALALVCAALLAPAGCGQPAEEEPQKLTLRVAMADSPDSLDPAMADSDTEKTLAVHLYENLMKLTESGPVPAQAAEYECVDNLDGTETYRFTLRSDAVWSDGRRVSAYDFVYAWRRLADPETGSPSAALLDMVAGFEDAAAGDPGALQVSAESDSTLVVNLNCHCPYFLSSVCTAAATMPVRSDAAAQSDWGSRRESLLTNGAYTVASWTGQQMRLEAAEHYYDSRRLGVGQLEFRFGVAGEEALAQFAQGELDVVMEAPETEGAMVSYRPEVTLLLVNQMSVTLQSEALRQAMGLVIDRQALCRELGGRFIPAEGLVPRGTAGTQWESFRELGGPIIDNRPENYGANCAAAVDALERVGYDREVMAELGVMTLLYEDTQELNVTAQQIQQMWQEQLGLRVTLRSAGAEELEKTLHSGVFTITLITVTSDRNDPTGYLGRFYGTRDENYGIFYSNAYNMLMRAAEAAKSPAARDAYLSDAERLLLQSGYVIPLYDDTHFWLVRSNLAGALDNGQDTHYFMYVRQLQTA